MEANDMKAMREALLALKKLDFNKEEDCHAFYRIIDAALSKPPRNFDRFANLHDAWVAWQSDCAYNIGTETMRFLVWLYSTAEKGETDGSK